MKKYLLLILLIVFSCTSEIERKNDELIAPKYMEKEKKAIDERYNNNPLVDVFDVNKDGIVDMWKVHEEIKENDQIKKILKRREIDLNFDGKINFIKFYTPKGNIEKEYLDKNLDGVIETIRYYENNLVVKIESYFTNPIDKKFNVIKDSSPFKTFYFNSNGTLKKVTEDTNKDKKDDYFLYFSKGLIDRIGIDEDGDLKVDKWIKKGDIKSKEEKQTDIKSKEENQNNIKKEENNEK